MSRSEQLLVGQSSVMRELQRLVDVVAPSASTVLLLGETGTGKEVTAKAIHKISGRRGRLISVNCSAIPSELLESELFGHEKGAFTGADKAYAGRFEQAQGGTLFLDEIGDMPLSLQAKLLRALEERTIQRVGSSKEINIDFRLVCATHQNIEAQVQNGDFRADLFFRINVFPLRIPSLAERAVDVPMLVAAIMKSLSADASTQPPVIDETAITELSRYNWPGNVRELRNVLERALLLFSGRVITSQEVKENLLRLKVPDRKAEQASLWEASEDLFGFMQDQDADSEEDDGSGQSPLPHPSHYRDWFAYFDHIDMRSHLRDIEAALIEAALQRSDGMISQAADMLRLRRTTLIEKMKKLMIERPPGGGQDNA